MSPWLERTLIEFGETAMACLPRQKPSAGQLAATTIVAHRGERDGVHVKENTFAAFDPAIAAGVGALEFDIRYTKDDEPVVHHDAGLARVFGHNAKIADLSWAALRRLEPRVPHLDEMIARYASAAILMVELKTRGSVRAEQRLHEALAALVPVRDFYFLSLRPELFAACERYPSASRIVVAKTNWAQMRDWAHKHACGGLAGPFLFITQADIDRLTREEAFIGSGFLTRRGLLMREIGRGVPWIFTNKPLKLQRLVDEARAQCAPSP